MNSVSRAVKAQVMNCSGLREHGLGWFSKQLEGTQVMRVFEQLTSIMHGARGDVVSGSVEPCLFLHLFVYYCSDIAHPMLFAVRSFFHSPMPRP